MTTSKEELEQPDEASIERDKQRTESEARDIIHDVERLYTSPEDKKGRWIWELLQNAKDVGPSEGITINIKLTQDRLEFSHNGKPFETKHLLAILYKTSTKSLNGEGGTTGKYGTGFVTTHILNKKLTIEGVHTNQAGNRRFSLQIDRSAATLDESVALVSMQKSLRHTFSEIQAIGKKVSEEIQDNSNTFIYNLTSDSYRYAEKGLIELRRNAAFTLLINHSIKKIEIQTPEWSDSFSIITEDTEFPDIQFASTESHHGLLFQKSDKLIFAIPVKREGNSYTLFPLDNQAVLYKEFPLIGTEKFNLPILLQHSDFHPTELRDGIRTKITNKDETDPIAIKNRNALTSFISYYLKFIEQLLPKVKNIHLVAKSGLPEHLNQYSNIDWFEENIQLPIRDYLVSKPIVTTVSGLKVKIEQAKFILRDLENKDLLFELASTVIPDQLPEKGSIWYWAEIISQELVNWPQDVEFTIEDLVGLVEKSIDLNGECSFAWLAKLYDFLAYNKLTHLGDSVPIYPTEAGNFKSRGNELYLYPQIDDEFKYVAKGLGRDLDDEFLNRKVGVVEGIKSFDLTKFYNDLNKNLISELKIENASDEQIKAIFHVCCLFKSDRAFKREQWLNTINQLLPELALEKKIIVIDYDNYYRSADFWSVKYVCFLIEKSKKPSVFAETYFEGHSESCFDWYNQFLNYVFSMEEESKGIILKKNIIPVQSNEFKAYNDLIYAADSQYFDDTIKDIFKHYTTHGDPRKNIVETLISNSEIRSKGIEILTNEIDKLFYPDNIDTKVKPGKEYNDLFLSLSAWVDQFPTLPKTCLPKFEEKRPHLNMLALGENFSQKINNIIKSGKSIDDIEDLAKINLTAEEMKQFELLSNELGTKALLVKAKEMLDAKYQIERWKAIGKVAEAAFEDAIVGLDAEFKIENPDHGKDFELIIEAKGYSIEIKSVAKGKEDVRMSALQGRTSSNNPANYALCVMTRPEDDQIIIDKEYFIKESRFVIDIGHQISHKIKNWDEGLKNLMIDDDVMVYLDEKTESIYIRREIWRKGISFNEFIDVLNKYFN